MEQYLVATVSLIGVLVAVISSYVAYQQGTKKDSFVQGAESGTLSTNVSYIKTRLDDVFLEQRDTNRKIDTHSSQLSEHSTQIARVEESAKAAHKRIDALCNVGK